MPPTKNLKSRSPKIATREKEDIQGHTLFTVLEHYSERGQAYIEEIEGLINITTWRFQPLSNQS